MRHVSISWLALSCFIVSPGIAAEPEATGRCVDGRYRQLAVSLPLQGLSDGREGHPWRVMYGYCLVQKGRFTLHQDWIISYLDVEPIGDAPGGDGVSFGTDFSVQWRHKRGTSLTPYYELGAGVQYAADIPIPAHGSQWTFTLNAGVGMLITATQTLEINTAFRYLHLSNAGVVSNNAGYDAYHFVVGVRWLL